MMEKTKKEALKILQDAEMAEEQKRGEEEEMKEEIKKDVPGAPKKTKKESNLANSPVKLTQVGKIQNLTEIERLTQEYEEMKIKLKANYKKNKK